MLPHRRPDALGPAARLPDLRELVEEVRDRRRCSARQEQLDRPGPVGRVSLAQVRGDSPDPVGREMARRDRRRPVCAAPATPARARADPPVPPDRMVASRVPAVPARVGVDDLRDPLGGVAHAAT